MEAPTLFVGYQPHELSHLHPSYSDWALRKRFHWPWLHSSVLAESGSATSTRRTSQRSTSNKDILRMRVAYIFTHGSSRRSFASTSREH